MARKLKRGQSSTHEKRLVQGRVVVVEFSQEIACLFSNFNSVCFCRISKNLNEAAHKLAMFCFNKD